MNYHVRRAVSAVLVGFLLITGTVPSSSRVEASPANAATTTDGPMSLVYVPGAEATLRSLDGKVEVRLPANLSNESLKIDYAPMVSWTSTAMRMVKQFRLEARAPLRKDAVVTTFTASPILTLRYTDADLAGLDRDSFRFFVYDDAQALWVPLNTSHDKAAKTVTASAEHFSVFGGQANPAYSLPGMVLNFQTDLYSGASTSRYPLELPPGPGGFEPRLELGYSSASVDEMKNRRDVGSWVGTGWSLHLGRVFYNEETAKYFLEWNGGSYKMVDAGGGSWYTVPDERFKLVKGVAGSYDFFDVWDRGGTRYRFGGTADSIQSRNTGSSTIKYRFDLSEAVDPHGNKMKVDYTRDVLADGTVRSAYPLDLWYDNDSGTETYRANVRFNSSFDSTGTPDGNLRRDTPRGTASNPAPPVVENKKLDSIEVKVLEGGVWKLARRYDFAYASDSDANAAQFPDYGGIYYAGKFRLTSVTPVGSDGTSVLPALSLSYANGQIYFYDPNQEDTEYLCVVDKGNNRMQKWTSRGDWHAQFGSAGTGNGQFSFNASSSVAVNYPNIYVTDSGNHRVQKFDMAGTFLLAWGSQGQGNGQFGTPTGIAVDQGTGEVYVADWTYGGTHRVQKFDANGNYMTQWGNGQFTYPKGVAVGYGSYTNSVFVADQNNAQVQKFTKSGAFEVKWGSHPADPGYPLTAVNDVAVDGELVYVLAGSLVKKFQFTSATAQPAFLTEWVAGCSSGDQGGLAVRNGYVYLTEPCNNKVKKFTSAGTLIREWGTLGSGDGQFNAPSDVAPAGWQELWGNPGNPARISWPRLTQAGNGYGGSVSYSYGQAPTYDPSNMWTRQAVLTRTVRPDPAGETGGTAMTTSYSYHETTSSTPCGSVGGFREPAYSGTGIGAEFRGFRQVRETRPDNSYLVHRYYTKDLTAVSHPVLGSVQRDGDKLTGREYDAYTCTSSGTQLRQAFTDWNYAWTNPALNVYNVRVDNGGTLDADGSGSGQQMWRYYTYDSYKNVTREEETGADGPSGDERTTFWTFSPNTTAWIVDKPATHRVYKANQATDDRGANMVSEGRFYYDSPPSATPAKGDLTKVEVYKDASSFVTATHAYDAYGNQTGTTDSNGNTTTFTFDTTYHTYLTQVTYPTVGGFTPTESSTWDFVKGRKLSDTDMNSQTTSYEYDTLGRPTKVIRPGDTSASPTERYSYLSWGTVAQQRVKVETKVASSPEDYLWADEYFDGLGRIIQVRQRDASPNDVIASTVQYDNIGHVWKHFVAWRVASTTASTYQSPPGGTRSTVTTYDALDRPLSITAPDGAQESHAYAIATSPPRLVWRETATDPLGHKKRSYSDAYGRLGLVEELDAADAVYGTTTYTYDALGDLTQVQDTAGNLTTMAYDMLSRKTSMTDPDLGSWSYAYDANGNLTAQTDARGTKLSLVYDALNRTTQRRECTIADCSTYNVLATYTYDDVTGGNVGRGRRTKMTDPSGALDYTYDSRGRLTKEVRTVDSLGYTTQYAYDPADRLATVTYPGDETATQAYDARGLPLSLTSSASGSLASGSLYNALGLPTQFDLGNGLRSTFGYWNTGGSGDNNTDCQPSSATDCYSRLWEIKTLKVADSSLRQQLRSTWDGGGNLTQRESPLVPETETFAYDFLDRLTSARTATDITSGLVAHWKLDDATGTAVADASGNGNTGTFQWEPKWMDGRIGKGLWFDGQNDHVQVPHSASLNISQQISAFAWVKPQSAQNGRIVQKDEAANRLWEMGMMNGSLRTELWHSDGTPGGAGGTAVPVGQWSYVGFTFDGSVVRAYQDGVQTGAANFSGDLRTGTNPVKIAGQWGGEWFHGTIDEVRIYNRALSAAEVQQLHRLYAESYVYTALGAHWKLDEGSGSIAGDSSGNDNRGALINGPAWTTGQYGQALSFDGVDDYVGVDALTGEGIVGDGKRWTVAAWAKLSATSEAVILGLFNQYNSNTFLWFRVLNGRIGVQSDVAGGNPGQVVDGTTTLSLNTWYHVAASFDYTTGAVTLYVNGVQDGSGAIDPDRRPSPSSLDGARIGSESNNRYFPGLLDDVRVYTRILASDEVQRVKSGQETAKDGALGNLFAKSGATYAYGSPKPHAVTQADGTTYGYDANGNITARGSETLAFNAENRLSQWTSGASTATFVYDGDGSRVKKTEGGQTTVYANRSYEKNVTTGQETLYYWLGGRLVAVKRGGTLGYVHGDHLGSTSIITDTAGAQASALTYFPYGSGRASTGTVPTERKFTGQRLDGTGLYYYGARYYDAGLGRFVSGDSIVPGLGNSQAWNRYSYVVNNPLRYVDPTGRWHRPDDELHVAFIEGPDPALPTTKEIELYETIQREHGWALRADVVRSRELGALLTGAGSYEEFLRRLSDAAGVSLAENEASYYTATQPAKTSAFEGTEGTDQNIFKVAAGATVILLVEMVEVPVIVLILRSPLLPRSTKVRLIETVEATLLPVRYAGLCLMGLKLPGCR